MLEHLSLWLSAPTAAWPPGMPRTGRCLRWVLAADSRGVLGHVAVTPARWWPWPAGRRIAAYESPDGSLLFTARRFGWLWPATVVAEADGQPVAVVRGRFVLGPRSRLVARSRSADGCVGTFVNGAGDELARWRPDGGGTVLDFTADPRHDPFVKMALLAAVLTG